jgi:methyl-accepting chemotaxis protein
MKSTGGTRFGIGTKLVIGLGTLIAISIIVGGLAALSMLSIQAESVELADQHLPESVLANQVERTILKVMNEMRGYWLAGDAQYRDAAGQGVADLEKSLADLQKLADKSPQLSKLRDTLPKVVAAKDAYTSLFAKTKELNDTIAKVRAEMDTAAGQFTDAANGYFDLQRTSQNAEFRAGMRASAYLQRAERVQSAHQILSWGDDLRAAVYKARALHDPEVVKGVLADFGKITDAVNTALRETPPRADRDQLALVQASASGLQAAIGSWLTANAALDDLAAPRLASGNTLADLAQQLSLDGVQTSQSVASANALLVGAANWTIVIGLLASLVLGSLVAFILVRNITVPLRLVTELSRRVAKGDFSIEREDVKGQDELAALTEAFYDMVDGLKLKAAQLESIASGVLTTKVTLASDEDGLGRSLQRMQESLNEILTQVNVAVDQMASGSDQVSTAAQSLSQGATEQASSLEEISASANEIHSQSKQNAENALTASQLAKQASQNAQLGNQQMKDLMVLVDKMTKSSEQTKSIVKTIDDIAFQVNLLALNANVEAARAGKYGKGFAVVADEVRNLAVRSAAAVSETTRMVEQSIRDIQEVNATAQKTGDQLNGIAGNANKVADFLGEIAASSSEQAKAMGQINGGLDQIDQVTQSNTASAEQSASASEELSGQAQQLKVMVGRFQLDDAALQKAMARSQAPVHPRAAALPAAPSLLRKAMPAARKPGQDIILNNDFDVF